MTKYFSKNIIDLIIDKISLDYIQYKIWCYDEGTTHYIWSQNDICKCPNNTHHITDIISIVDTVKSNGNILNIKKVNVYNNVWETTIEIIQKNYIKEFFI